MLVKCSCCRARRPNSAGRRLDLCFPLQVSLDNMWITISSGVLGFSFIFGNTLSQQLQTILLIFVVHPFDVGDALLLDGAFVTVEQTSLNKARVGASDLELPLC